MKKIVFVMVMFLSQIYPVFAQEVDRIGNFQIDFKSSYNPVGSGARAIGMGGAFIAIANDATAASWNPGGLVHVQNSEISIVGNYFHLIEDNTFGIDPNAGGNRTVYKNNINYLSATWVTDYFKPFNMAFSVNYQHLYDLTRKWNFSYHRNPSDFLSEQTYIDYQQEGGLSAVGLAYSVLISEHLSVGATLNIWSDNLSENNWEKVTYQKSDFVLGSNNIHAIWLQREKYSFSGINANFGFLWKIGYALSIGGVLKMPFKADISYQRVTDILRTDISSQPENPAEEQTLQMPMSYGLGIAYQFPNDKFKIALDIYRTQWNDFTLTDEKGNETSAITGKSDSDIAPTTQVRLGMEYRIIKKDEYVIPLRAGLFYDPAPAIEKPDDFYGFSLGTGIKFLNYPKLSRFSFDVAYQYRFGNGVGESVLNELKFSQDVKEHTVYSSLIVYF